MREIILQLPGCTGPAVQSLEQIAECRAGYRCGYIHETAAAVAGSGFDTERLATMQTADARKELMKYKGVGGKVADCVLLYSGIKYDVFPVDVWVKRVMEELYFGREAGFPEIHRLLLRNSGSMWFRPAVPVLLCKGAQNRHIGNNRYAIQIRYMHPTDTHYEHPADTHNRHPTYILYTPQ